MKRYIKPIVALCLSFSLLSCEKMMDVDSSMKLEGEDHYSSLGEVYGAFIGLYGSFMKVAEKTVILSDLKGDLLTPTANAPEEYWRIFRYEPTTDTRFNNPKEFYDVVINANDFLRRVVTYNRDLPGEIPANVYKGMISNAICFKAWSLMTAGKLFGEARFYSTIVTSGDESGMINLSLAELPDFLLSYMQGGEDGVNAYNSLDWKVLLGNTSVDWSCRNVDPDALSGELCLWAGRYQEAVNYFFKTLSSSADLNRNLSPFNGGDWYKLFAATAINQKEMITALTFDANNGQEQQLNKYFSSVYPGLYYFAPTERAMDFFRNEILGESYSYRRGDLRIEGTYSTANGQPEVIKYALRESANPYADDAFVHIYRAGGVHLMLAEAFAFMGNYDAALALLDKGVAADYYISNAWSDPFISLFPAFATGNKGVRSRVGLLPLEKDEIFSGCVDGADSLRTMAGRIADEVAREQAFEGQRWFALMRMAGNLNSPAFLADRVAPKFGEAENYRQVLMNEKNWFIK